jgi:hypothetical protein
MKRLMAVLVLAVCVLGLNACLRAPLVPPIGNAFSDLKAPLDIDYNNTALATKSGTSESMSILGLVALGDASAATAAAAGQITTITHADYEYFNVLGVYQRYRTVVRGN